jgi:hypothetical protein
VAVEPLLDAELATRSSMPTSIGFSTMPSILMVHGRIFSACACLATFFARIEFVEIVVVAVDPSRR